MRGGVTAVSEQLGSFEVMYSCRAMRRLKPDALSEDLLLKLCDAGNQGPTGSNIQSVRWVIVREQARKDRGSTGPKNCLGGLAFRYR